MLTAYLTNIYRDMGLRGVEPLTSRLSGTYYAGATAHSGHGHNLLQSPPSVSAGAHETAIDRTSRADQNDPTLTGNSGENGPETGDDRALTSVRSVCGWCNESHPIRDCPNRPRLSAASVLAFVAAAMVRGGRARAWT
jgi:hypothetical protein